jgi:hypothetical protein
MLLAGHSGDGFSSRLIGRLSISRDASRESSRHRSIETRQGRWSIPFPRRRSAREQFAAVAYLIYVDVVRPAADGSPETVWLRPYRTWVLTGGHQRKVSSGVEHQTKNLAVTGSTPVPHVGLKPTSRVGRETCSTMKPNGGERSSDRPSPWFARVRAAREGALQNADSAAALAR